MPKIAGELRPYYILKFFNFFAYGAIVIYATFFPLYLKQIGTSTVQIGALMAGGPFISILANPFWGYLSDRMQNVKRIILILLLGNLIVMQVVFQLKSFSLIYMAMIFYFFFQSPLFSQTNSLILNAIEGTPYKFGAFRLWGSLGWAFIAIASGPIIGWLGIGQLWIVYSFMMLITIVIAVALPHGPSTMRKLEGTKYRDVFANRHFLLFIVIGIVIAIPNSINSTFYGIYMSDLGGKEVLIGWTAFVSAIFEVPVFLLLDRYLGKNTRVMIFCLAAVSCVLVIRWMLMSIVTQPYHILLIQFLHSFTFGIYFYVGTQLTASLVPAQYRATGQAVYALSWGGLAGIVAGLFGGWMYQNLGPKMMYQISALFSLTGAISFIMLLVMMNKPERQLYGKEM